MTGLPWLYIEDIKLYYPNFRAKLLILRRGQHKGHLVADALVSIRWNGGHTSFYRLYTLSGKIMEQLPQPEVGKTYEVRIDEKSYAVKECEPLKKNNVDLSTVVVAKCGGCGREYGTLKRSWPEHCGSITCYTRVHPRDRRKL